MRTALVLLMACLCSVPASAQIVVSGGRQSIIVSGRGRQAVRSPSGVAAPRQPADLPEVKPPAPKPAKQHAAYREVRYLVSEPWCIYCPAAKRRFLAAGNPASNIISIATARAMGHHWSGSVPHEFTVRQRVQTSPKPAATTRRVQVQPAWVQWQGRNYDPRTYRRCGDPRCQMCNYITSARVWQATSVTLPAGQQPTPDDVIAEMLGYLDLQESDVLADLGCGDGRILIEAVKRYGCSGVGIEIDAQRAQEARQLVASAGLSDRIEIITGDVRDFNPERHGVTALTAYLFPELLAEISDTIASVRIAVTPFHAVPGLDMQQIGSVYVYRGS